MTDHPGGDQDQSGSGRTFSTIAVTGSGAVRVVALNRPERHNAQNLTMWREITDAFGDLSAQPEVVAVIVKGCGHSFSSGIDLHEFTRPGGFIRTLAEHPVGTPDPMLGAIHDAQRVITAIRRAPFVTIAQLSGAVLGAGMQLALACDIRIVAADARIALLECTKQMLPDLGATWSLPRLIGRERALDLILTGRELTGGEAVAAGVALRSLPAAGLDTAVNEYAVSIAGMSRAAVAYVKASIDAQDEADSLRIAAIGQAACIRNLSPH
ncbi:enoyl-CoA hydratase/isomerase family protein [Gordonia polyisoprenivorans]|uniref:enoyl-CoA hydratase/isomerase family protein n=1 Tax=Gordonia polyisoprenivorans TaxID=84595 RepID=UPI001AD76D0A|nr:enoyl-CoA hydratase/isomerase family protein [Gordonia polyisoprenivorans]QTI69025.1 enoyl-CoA hydratase/isomerase family protein [Gordonia polyisoprenivorans]